MCGLWGEGSSEEVTAVGAAESLSETGRRCLQCAPSGNNTGQFIFEGIRYSGSILNPHSKNIFLYVGAGAGRLRLGLGYTFTVEGVPSSATVLCLRRRGRGKVRPEFDAVAGSNRGLSTPRYQPPTNC